MATDTRTYHRVLLGFAYLAAYIALDYISYLKPYRGLGITPWNPPPGLTVAVVFLGGRVFAPFVLIAPALADVWVRGAPLGAIAELISSVSIGSVYLATGLLLQKSTRFDPRFRSAQDALSFIAISAGSAALATSLNVAVLMSFGAIEPYEIPHIAWRAAIGDLIGILVLTPLLLLISAFRPWPKFGTETVLQVLSIIAALVIVFGYREATAFQLFYVLFLPLLWVSMKHGPPGAAIALALIQLGLIMGAEIRFGADPGLSALQALMTALAITGLVVGSIVAEREDGASRLREQQAAINRALRIRSAGEVAATIAHEINQPLTTLTTYSGIARQALADGKTELAQKAVERIEQECERTTAVLRSIRELLNQGSLSIRPVKLKDCLQVIVDLLAPDLLKKGIVLTSEYGSDLPPIAADGIQLQQALHNLVINAADAIATAGRAGQIAIAVSIVPGPSCNIEVSDNGPGFPPGFNVLDPSPFTTTKAEGSGIGLSVARSIAEAHGGRLDIVTSPRGARVRLSFPIARV